MLNFGDVNGKNLWLFTPEEFLHLPDGIRLTDISDDPVDIDESLFLTEENDE